MAFVPSGLYASLRKPCIGAQNICQHELSQHFSRPPRPSFANWNMTAAQTRICRRCKTKYVVSENHPRACRYHSGIYSGDSKRKGNWDDDTYTTGAGQVERFWWCCGEKDIDAEGCCFAPHQSYDE